MKYGNALRSENRMPRKKEVRCSISDESGEALVERCYNCIYYCESCKSCYYSEA